MKTETNIEEAVLSPGLETKAMGMVLSATSFNHIINSLYKNPLGAILRELTTNALESHMAAGSTRKVAIQLPIDIDQNLTIRDFGTGLTDEDVQKYLNSLFSTSKDKDNTYMGGFGLGSKSPLALVDTFNIVSIHKGLKNNYAWIKEAGKLPNLIHLDDEEDRDEPTKEEDGIKITIPLGSSTKISQGRLKATVEEEARRQLLGFVGKIMFVDNIHEAKYADLNDITETVIKEKIVLDLPHLTLYSRDKDTYYPDTNTVLIMVGGVNYPFTSSYRHYVTDLFKHFLNGVSNYLVCLKAPIGTLEIPMSREELLTSAHNEDVIKDTAKKAEQDIVQHIKSLNINLDTNLVDYYTQLKNAPKKQSGEVEFKLVIPDSTFQAKDKPLIDFYDSIKQGSRTLSMSSLAGDRLPNKLFTSFLETLKVSVVQYDMHGNKERYTGYSSFNVYNKPYSIVTTTSPLPKGVTHAFLHAFLEETLKPKYPLLIIQLDESLHSQVHLLTDVLIAYQDYALPSASEYLGIVDETAITKYKDDIKAYNKANPTARTSYTRATLDFIPGARLRTSVPSAYDLHVAGDKLHMSLPNDKVTALETALGKRIPIGPEYIPAGKSVMLVVDHKLPVDLSAFNFDHLGNPTAYPVAYNRSNACNISFQDVVILKVTVASYKSCLARLEAAKIIVYTETDPLKLVRPTKKDIPSLYLANNFLESISTHLKGQLGVYGKGIDYIAPTVVDEFTKLLPLHIKDTQLLADCQALLATFKVSKEFFGQYSKDLSAYTGYSKAALENQALAFSKILLNAICSNPSATINKHLYELANSGLQKNVFNTIIDNLITQAVIGQNNEIQTKCDSTV